MVVRRAGGDLRILCVCTANICRSPSAEHLLRDALAEDPAVADVEVRSAGTYAVVGARGCSVAPALAGRSDAHRSTPLSAELVAWADLILTAAREHRRTIVAVEPSVRPRTFTLRQAGRISDWVLDAGMIAAARERTARGRGSPPLEASAVAGQAGVGPAVAGQGSGPGWAERFPAGDPRAEVPALPVDVADRWVWLLGELDAARVMAAGGPSNVPVEPGPVPRRGPRLRRRGAVPGPDSGADGDAEHVDDVPDPHVLGFGLHPMAHEQLDAATGSLVRLIREVVA